MDVIFKGLMAAESRTRQTSFLTRGPLIHSHRDHLPESDPFWHCNPLSVWTDDDIWAYIRRFNVPYSPLYDVFWEERIDGSVPDPDCPGALLMEYRTERHYIPRNGCMACGTDLLFNNNHLSSLRRTHPEAWRVFMKRGLADEIRKLQQCKRNGQYCIFDALDTRTVMLAHPCAFDSLDGVVMEELFYDGNLTEYDPDADTAPLTQEATQKK